MLPDTIYLNLPLFVLGLVIIIRGSDLFLDNAVWMARAAGISQVIIGATVVSLCTTLPELVSSVTAALKGTADMALGNAVGSVICNTGLILGAALLFVTARIQREVFLIKGVFMVGSLLAAFFLLMPTPRNAPLQLSRPEGAVLLIVLAVFMVVNYYESLHGADKPVYDGPPDELIRVTRKEWIRRLAVFALGAALLTFGAYLLIEYGQRLARNLGVSEAVISLVFVALGTSLPELFTAISAVRKKAEGISVGNIFGANVLNLSLVIGATASIRPLEVREPLLLWYDIPVATGLCGCAFAAGLVRGRVGRKTGSLLLLLYAAYLISMIFRLKNGTVV